MNRPNDPHEERRKLFRRIEWVFVYTPPLLILFFSIFGGLFLAYVIPIPRTTMWGRFALALLVILVLPALVYAVRESLKRR